MIKRSNRRSDSNPTSANSGRAVEPIGRTRKNLRIGGAALALVALLASASYAANEVAALELGAPSIPSFVLHGTIPVPKGTYPRADGLVPFSILDVNGAKVPTQVEIVSRYPNDADGADVVEVLGRVNLAPNTAAGTRVTYEVIDDPHAPVKFAANKPVLGMLSQPGTMLLVAEDCFGNQYTLDLVSDSRMRYSNGSLKVLRDGVAASQFRTYGVMVSTSSTPVGPPSGPLPHFFGVHAYFTAWSKSDAFSLDLRVSSGTSGLDTTSKLDDPMGNIYFKSLELWVKKGWDVQCGLVDSAQGAAYDAGTWTAYPLVAKRADGKLNLMPSQGQFHRRLGIAPSGKDSEALAYAREEHLGFCRRGQASTGNELFSWWNPATPRYFTQKHRLPELDFLGATNERAKLSAAFATTSKLVQTGVPDKLPYPTVPAMGWAYPWGAKYGGMTGGDEIWMYDGLTTADSASNDGYRGYQATHRMYSERQPTTLYNLDGEPTRVANWIIHGSKGDYIPMYFFLTLQNGNDPFGFKNAPTYQNTWVKAQGLTPPYEADLLGYHPIDFQHYVRRTRSEKVLVWLGNDAIAKDDVHMDAELFRLSYVDVNNDPNGNTIGSGLLADMQYTTKNPGKGFSFGRGEGWGIDITNAAYSTQSLAWRHEALPWYKEIADVVIAGQGNCNGFWQNMFNSKWLSGQYRARQSFEQVICDNALVGAANCVLRDVDPARLGEVEQSLKASFYANIGPMGWSTTSHGPWTVVAVAPLTGGQIFCGSLPPNGTSGKPDKYYTWSSFAYGYEMTGDLNFITMAEQMIGGDLQTVMESQGYTTLENRAALLALAQSGTP